MRHAYESDASTTAPLEEVSNDPGFPTDSDPPTVIGTYWVHGASSEIIEVIEEGGLTPDDDVDQMARAIPIMIQVAFQALSIPVLFDFATRNEHIQANPPGDEAANPRDARFAGESYFVATAFDFATRNEHTQANPPGDEAANPRDARFAIQSYFEARA